MTNASCACRLGYVHHFRHFHRFRGHRPAGAFLRSATLLIALAACAPAQKGPVASMRRMVDYNLLVDDAAHVSPAASRARYGDEPLQFGEFRLPAGATGRRPVIVLLHGGCWRSAYDLTYTRPAAAALAAQGYVVWTPEYRRLGDPGGGWPGTFTDVARAIDDMRMLETRFPTIDTARVVLVGHSAGGSLALWAASRHRGSGPTDLRVPGESPLAVKGVVSLAAISDLASYGAARGGCNAAVTPLMGGPPPDVPGRYREVNPAEHPPLSVPVRLVQGAADPVVPPDQARRYEARARAAGADVRLTLVADAGHFDLLDPQSTAWPAVIDAIRSIAPPTDAPRVRTRRRGQ